jgi:Mg-chelatase subunit ChlD
MENRLAGHTILVAVCSLSALLTSAPGCGSDPSAAGSGTFDTPVNGGAGTDAAVASGTPGGATAGGATTGAAGGTTAGGTTGAAPASAGGTNPAGLCQQFSIDSGRVTPDMLIVLDRSSSMQGQGVDRWTPSVRGIKAVTAQLDSMIHFGLMAFPGRGADATLLGGGGMSCAAGTLEVPVGPRAAAAIATSLDGLMLVQTTPTATTLEAAHGVLGSGTPTLDSVSSAKFVILVTDGAPNCSTGTGGGRGGAGNDPAAVAASVAAIAAMKTDGIKTYVLGYDTQNDPTLKAALDQMAQAGGTGDTEHRAIENEASLTAEFRRIIGGATSCEFALNTPPSDPNFVLVQLDGAKLALGAADGFTLSADRKRLTVQGSACTKLQSQTENHVLTVKVECERQTPLF